MATECEYRGGSCVRSSPFIQGRGVSTVITGRYVFFKERGPALEGSADVPVSGGVGVRDANFFASPACSC